MISELAWIPQHCLLIVKLSRLILSFLQEKLQVS